MTTESPAAPANRTLLRTAAVMAIGMILFVGVQPAGADPSAGPPVGPSGDGLAQTLDPDQAEANGRAVLAAGHIDVGPRYRDGRWTVQIHDDSHAPSVWRRPTDTVLQVRDTARQPIPDDKTYAFLGEQAGTDVYVIPQTQQQDVVWIGWNTQDPGVMKAISRGVTMNLRGVQGPGRVTVYLQSGNLGAPQVLWTSAAAYPQPLWVETNTHTHANWVFGKPGVYLVAIDVTAELADGTTTTGSAVLRFAVGDATSTDDAVTAAFTAPLATLSAAAAASAAASAAEGGPEATAAWLTPVIVVAAVLLLTVLLGVVLRGAAVRRRAERERAHDGKVHR